MSTETRMLLASSKRIIETDRFDRLVQALAQLPSAVTATILGDGPDRPRLEQLAAAYGLGERLSFATQPPVNGAFRIVFPSPLNAERAILREVHGSLLPVRVDPDGPFAPDDGRVRTLGELVEVLS